MENFGTLAAGSAAPHKQEDVKFDASQYEFFGKNVMEHELEGLDALSEKPAEEDILSPERHKDSANDLSISFTKLNLTSEPRTVGGIASPKGCFSSSRRATGTIKWYCNKKGYGFIIPNEGGLDVFVHSSSLKSDGYIHLSPGTHVEYETIYIVCGKIQAINVTVPRGQLLQDSRKLGLGEVRTKMVAQNCCIVAQSGAWQYQYVTPPLDPNKRWKVSSNLVQCEGWPALAWCYYCGRMVHFYHN